MLSCIMVGDSIAVGVGQARPECETIAQVGISSSRYIATLLPAGQTEAATAVISLGVNDDASLDTIGNLREVRSRIVSPNVIWLLPALKENVRAMIRTVAAENGDRTLDTRPQAGRDHLHPNGAGYEIIAAKAMGPAEEEVAAYETRVRSVPRHPLAPRRRVRPTHAAGHAPTNAQTHAASRVRAPMVAHVRPASMQHPSAPASLHAPNQLHARSTVPMHRLTAQALPHRQLVACTSTRQACLAQSSPGRI
jgi:lysophospholipase L1-like esterase